MHDVFVPLIDLDNLSDDDDDDAKLPSISTRPIIPTPRGTPLTTQFPPLQSLPAQLSEALIEGSNASNFARKWLDGRLAIIPHRMLRRTMPEMTFSDGEPAYADAKHLCRDFDQVVNFLWYIATPTLSISYGLEFAKDFPRLLKQLDPAPVPTFIVLRKFDHLFASLFNNKDPVTQASFPGSNSPSPSIISMTYTVRMQSVIDTVKSDIFAQMRGCAGYDDDDWHSDMGGGVEDESDDEDLGPSYNRYGELLEYGVELDEPLKGVNKAEADVEVDGSGWRAPVTKQGLGIELGQMFQQTIQAIDVLRGDDALKVGWNDYDSDSECRMQGIEQ